MPQKGPGSLLRAWVDSMQLQAAGHGWLAEQAVYFGKHILTLFWPGKPRQPQLGRAHALSVWQAAKTHVHVAGWVWQTVGRVCIPPSGRMPPPPSQLLAPGLQVNGTVQSASVAHGWASAELLKATVRRTMVPTKCNARLVILTARPPWRMSGCSGSGSLPSSDGRLSDGAHHRWSNQMFLAPNDDTPAPPAFTKSRKPPRFAKAVATSKGPISCVLPLV